MNILLEKSDNVYIQEGYLAKESDESHYYLLSQNTFDSYSDLLSAYRLMIYNTPFYDIFHYPEYRDALGNELMIYAPKIYFNHIDKIVHELMKGTISFPKESQTSMCWYETKNNFMLFFGELAKELLLEKIDEDCLKADFEDEDIISLSLKYLEQAPVDSEAREFLKCKMPTFARRMTLKDYKKFKEIHGNIFRYTDN